MELNPERIQALKGDTVLVRLLPLPERTSRGFYIPANAADGMRRSRRKAWRAEVVKFGDKVDWESFGSERPAVGDTVLADPASKDCPGFQHGEDTFLIIRDEDLLAKEASNV